MTWLPSALVFSAISSALLAATFLYVWHAYVHRPYVLVWSFAWWAAVGHLASGWWSVQHGGSTANWVVQQLFLVTNATLMLGGCWSFTRGRRAFLPALALASPFLTWVALAPQFSLSFTQIELPGALLLASAYSLTSYRFFVLHHQQGPRGAAIVAILFALAAIHELDYPVLRQVPGFAPVGYAIAASLAAAIALFLLVLILEQARVSAQTALQDREVLAARLSELVDDLDQKVLERTRELEEATREAQVANSAKSDFLARMSHEIRTPLNGIVGVVEMIVRRKLDSETRDLLAIARQSANSLLTIVNDVLDFSKIEAGKLELESIGFSPQELCEEVTEVTAESAYGKGLELIAHVAPSLPHRLLGDPTRLRQILVNLTSNAVKFTAQGRVVVRASYRSGKLRCDVEDTGVGLSGEAQSVIFEAFAQADSSMTRRFGGTGLGLAICQRLLEQMGGELRLESRAGVGSSFWFEIEAGLDPGTVPPEELDLGSRRALVSTEDTVLRETLSAYLESWGASCEIVDPSQAPERLRLETFDLILCEGASDSASPFEGVRTEGIILRLVPFSGRGSGTAAGADRTLVKPVTRSRLANALRTAFTGTDEPTIASEADPSSSFLGRRILLVEDDAVNALVSSSMLETFEATVVLASNGVLGVASAQKQVYDLIFLDCEMPEMDGYTAIAEIRRKGLNQKTPVVALTAHATARDRQRCLDAGMDDYIAKPVTFLAIEKILARWLPST